MNLKVGILFQLLISLALASQWSPNKGSFLRVPVKSESGVIHLSVVSEDLALQIFKELAAQEHIPFNYVLDGCYARAHEMSWLLEKQGVSSGKIFIAGPLKAWDRFQPGWWVEWKGYHVAPVIAVRRGDRIMINVIDPSVADKLLSMDEWLDLITVNGVTQKPFFAERFTYKFSSKKDNHRWLEEDLKDAKKTLNYFRNK